MVEANHCPGSAMFLFESLKTGAILHTGDFRFDRSMLNHPLLVNKSFDVVYLDTTYFDPAYEFPPQRDVIEFMVEEVQKFTSDTLIVCGSYTIGQIFSILSPKYYQLICDHIVVNRVKNFIFLTQNVTIIIKYVTQ